MLVFLLFLYSGFLLGVESCPHVISSIVKAFAFPFLPFLLLLF